MQCGETCVHREGTSGEDERIRARLGKWNGGKRAWGVTGMPRARGNTYYGGLRVRARVTAKVRAAFRVRLMVRARNKLGLGLGLG